jgi:sugar phosphate permease
MLSALTGTVRSRVFFLCYLCYGASASAEIGPEGAALRAHRRAAAGVVYFARKPFSIIKSEMADTLGLSTAALGYIDTAFLVAYAGGQFFVPRLGDKYSEWCSRARAPTSRAQRGAHCAGARPVMFGGMLGAAVASAFFSVSSSPQALIFWYFVNGLAQSGLYATCVSALTHVFDSTTKGTVLGTWSTCQNLGSFFAATMASALMGSTGEYLTCLYVRGRGVGARLARRVR